VHWNAAEAAKRAAALRALGYEVDSTPPDPRAFLRALREQRPAAVVIDLERAPSMGRDLAVMVREQKATRDIPLVFAGGEPVKVERVRALLPDAAYAAWDAIGPALAAAIAAPPASPVVPGSTLAGYSGTPLPKKLGLKPGTVLALLDAPPGFAATLGALPPGATITTSVDTGTTLAIWFVRRRADLAAGIARRAAGLGDARLWIVWPKKTSALAADLGQQDVRDIGLAHGLVDFKVCAVDDTWSGLRFVRRKPGAR
jgi:CheY-like chemotaxis protein